MNEDEQILNTLKQDMERIKKNSLKLTQPKVDKYEALKNIVEHNGKATNEGFNNLLQELTMTNIVINTIIQILEIDESTVRKLASREYTRLMEKSPQEPVEEEGDFPKAATIFGGED